MRLWLRPYLHWPAYWSMADTAKLLIFASFKSILIALISPIGFSDNPRRQMAVALVCRFHAYGYSHIFWRTGYVNDLCGLFRKFMCFRGYLRNWNVLPLYKVQRSRTWVPASFSYPYVSEATDFQPQKLRSHSQRFIFSDLCNTIRKQIICRFTLIPFPFYI